ncbi:unnamed protein product, partial [marine sediment metagenome]
TFLDGGMRLLGIEPHTGNILIERRLSGITGDSGDAKNTTSSIAVLPDVLSSDGSHIYLRDLIFDLEGTPQDKGEPHLQASAGFLDDSWVHRMYWRFGTKPFGPKRDSKLSYQLVNVSLTGRILSFEESLVYGFGRTFAPGNIGRMWSAGVKYHLFCAGKNEAAKADAMERLPRRGREVTGKPLIDYTWTKDISLQARAMVLARDTLFVAGPPADAHKSMESWEGKKGALLQGVNAA